MALTRRLTAILAADVAGYSRLMGVDEEGTHERLKAHRRELVDPKIKEHRGRIVQTNGHVPHDQRIVFRIGVNLGDVIIDGGDIYGDGVNIAARLEALAEPSGICISRVVRDQVRDKLDFTFEDRGEQQVKNIARPVRVYRIPIAEKAPARGPLP